MKIIKINHIKYFFFLIAGLLIYNYSLSIRLGMNHSIGHAVERSLVNMSVAISDINYGLKGYRGYGQVFDILKNNIITFDDNDNINESNLTNDEVLNSSINKTLNISVNSLEYKHMIFRDDIGLSSYYKLSFILYGYSISSLNKMYFTILFVSVFCFFITFKRNNDLLTILSIVLCAHLAMLSAINTSMQLKVVHNTRVLPVLAIIPSLHLCYILRKLKPFCLLYFITSFIQSCIITFIVHIRNVGSYFIIFIILVMIISILNSKFFELNLGYSKFNKINFNKIILPLLCILFSYSLLSGHLILNKHFIYRNNTAHLFWDMIYKNLGTHSILNETYGIKDEDYYPHTITKTRLKSNYGIDWETLTPKKYYFYHEKISRSEIISIFLKEPFLVIQSFINKPMMFLSTYINSEWGRIRNLFSFPIILFLILIYSLSTSAYSIMFQNNCFILIFLFCISLIPSILTAPSFHHISDVSLIFTVLIYITLFWFINNYLYSLLIKTFNINLSRINQ